VKRLGVPRGELVLLLVSGLVRWHCDQGTIPDPCGARDRGSDPDRGGGGNLRGAHDREDPRDRGGSCAAGVDHTGDHLDLRELGFRVGDFTLLVCIAKE
jgi:hypothetical protein